MPANCVSATSGRSVRRAVPRSYRVIAIAPGLAPTTMRVTGAHVTTGQRCTKDFFLVNRVEVCEEPT